VNPEKAVAWVLLICALRSGWDSVQDPEPDWDDPQLGMATWLPDLNRSGVAELECVPGTGPARAELIVRERKRLGFPLKPSNLALLLGVGEGYANGVQKWYARFTPTVAGNSEGIRKRNQKEWAQSKLREKHLERRR
jgi:hypothetical protein|tara:strand:- start:4831 stop:5241 length:411 start_codon:yes stop_codon:yes gene_type:complete